MVWSQDKTQLWDPDVTIELATSCPDSVYVFHFVPDAIYPAAV